MIFLGAMAAGACALGGCDTAVPPPVPKPHDGVSLTLSCPDAAFADAIAPMVRAWGVRTGATVTLSREPMAPADAADLGVIPTGHLGAWAEPGHLAEVPAKLRAGDHPIQWFGFLTAYGDRLVEWGARTRAVPLTGDGHVLVYRADRFADKAAAAEFVARFRRPLAPPATWEEFAQVAEFFAARDKRPSLPPLPADPGRAFDLLSRVAASLDRPALTDKDLDVAKDPERLAFHFTTRTGEPRLRADGFRAAADLLADLRAKGALPAGASDGTAAALATDTGPALAVVSLDQLAALVDRASGAKGGPRLGAFGVGGVPGAKHFFDPVRNARVAVPGEGANYVPYFAGGRLGVVRARCPSPDAAFELLAELGGPARGAELIATPGLGAGPTRTAHLDPTRLLPWLAYGFDEARSKALQEALRHYTGPAVKNPTYGLRGPDRAPLALAGGEAVKRLGAGAGPGDALTEAQNAWNTLDARSPDRGALRAWRQRAAGLN
ncbi:MAG: extracellular solute-binding protein [Gemmata sp.]